MTTQAERIAESMESETRHNPTTGMAREQWDRIEAACREAGAEVDHPASDTIRCAFSDGSAIIACGPSWDVRAAGCKRWCWEGGGCECEAERGYARGGYERR